MNRPSLPAESPEFGLIAWLEATRIVLPLKGVECRFEVTGTVACVELDQIYHQNAAQPLDCTYTFPLPAGAAVYRCELHVNGRVIRARVESREAARKIFREKKAAGQRAALVETERENLFTLSLGNVQPDDLIVVRFAWFQVIDHAADGLRLLVPTCPGVRYIPGEPLLRGAFGSGTAEDTGQVPDASRISPPRIEALHPDAAYFSIEGRLSPTDVVSGTASSPTHPIFVREKEDAVTVRLSGHDAVPDRDFVLAWREPQARQLAPQSWRWTEKDATYALVQLRAPEIAVATDFTQDVYFLIDRSGSMGGAKWQRTCEALVAFVRLLGAEDRVWITLFESGFRDFSEAPMPAPAVLADCGFQRMAALGVGGGTELLPATQHVLKQITRHSADRNVSVVLITDGQVGNEAEIVRAFQAAPQVRVHTFGIDTAVNDAFLKSLARRHGGGCWLQTPDDDIAGTVAALGDRLRRPVLTHLAVAGAWESGRTTLPDLHAGEVLNISLQGQATAPLEITGLLPNGEKHRFAVELGAVGNESTKLLWARERIAALHDADRGLEAVALAREFNLVCQGAAFIAWDDAEQVQIAQISFVQPAVEQISMMRRRACAPIFCLDQSAPAPMAPPPPPDMACMESPEVFESLAESASDFIRRLRLAFQEIRITESEVASLCAWIKGRGEKQLPRVKQLGDSLESVVALEKKLESQAIKANIESGLRKALGDSPEAVLKWSEDFGPASARITPLDQKLKAKAVPLDLIDQLFIWALASVGSIDQRLKKLEAFVDALEQAPFSTTGSARLWRTFLEETVGASAEVLAMATVWLPEIGSVPPGSSLGRARWLKQLWPLSIVALYRLAFD
jgi:Ca-activated chloride channel family protein